jgi:hypothetical protein
MIPVQFPGFNVVFGMGQPQYQPLPALFVEDAEGTVITCWGISDEELETIVKTRRIYFKQLTFNHPLQPILPLAQLGDDIKLP